VNGIKDENLDKFINKKRTDSPHFQYQ